MPCSANHYLVQGQYAEQIERYIALFDRSQMLAIQSERMFEDPDSVFGDVLRFLGIEEVPLMSREALNVGKRKNKSLPSSSLDVSASALSYLRSYFGPWNRRLKDLLPGFDVWSD